MRLSPLTAISPLDGRYGQKTEQLRPIVSEYGLIFYRLTVEIHWLFALSANKTITELGPLTADEKQFLQSLIDQFDEKSAESIKLIEKKINHDVKAVEYYLRDQISSHNTLHRLIPFIHFACTSEDINNLAYALMTKCVRDEIILPSLQTLTQQIDTLAQQSADFAMLSRTHGQPATPTTLGKELKNFAARLMRAMQQLKQMAITGKCNGAVGNFNAHLVAYPNIDWLALSRTFVESLALEWNEYTTQIEPHDQLAQLLHTLSVCNTILIDFCRDMWGYISLDYFSQHAVKDEIGSSTMPHKINPIDFENAEGNLGVSIALSTHLAHKLPISRWQRDLTDSTVLRNVGSLFGYSVIAYQAITTGIKKLTPNKTVMEIALNQHWEILAEPIQTMMRRYGIMDAYEQLKAVTRGKIIDQQTIEQFIDRVDIPQNAKTELKNLTPTNYWGYAVSLAKKEIK